jgi:hypothetical protein
MKRSYPTYLGRYIHAPYRSIYMRSRIYTGEWGRDRRRVGARSPAGGVAEVLARRGWNRLGFGRAAEIREGALFGRITSGAASSKRMTRETKTVKCHISPHCGGGGTGRETTLLCCDLVCNVAWNDLHQSISQFPLAASRGRSCRRRACCVCHGRGEA